MAGDAATDAKEQAYATERSKELASILAGVGCEFAITASLKLVQAPRIKFKEGQDLSTVVMAPDSDILKQKVEETKTAEEEKKKSAEEKEEKEWSYVDDVEENKPDWMFHREAALAEQQARFAPLREAMPRASFGHGKKVS